MQFPRYQSTSVFPTTSDTWRDVVTFFSCHPAAKKGRHAFGIHLVYRETFLQTHMHLHQLLILKNWIHGVRQLRPLHMSTAEKSEWPEQNQDLRCQSGLSAKDSVIFSGGDSSKNYGADQQRLQISDLHLWQVPCTSNFACWKMRFKTKVCTCSQFPTEAMQWIKEVKLVDSVDELRSSSSVRGISMPKFGVLCEDCFNTE